MDVAQMSMMRSFRRDPDVKAAKLAPGTWQRIVRFAAPYRRQLLGFLAVIVVGGGGRRRPAADLQEDHRRRDRHRTRRRPVGPVWSLALAAADRRAGAVRRCPVAGQPLLLGAHRRGADLRPAQPGLRPRPAHADRVLHPYPDRRAHHPAQQRRARRAAGVHRHAVQRREQRDRRGAHARRDVRPLVADHPALAGAAAAVRPPGPARRRQAAGAHPRELRAQRRDEHHDDRALQRLGRAARQALRPAGARGARRSATRPAGSATSASPPRCTAGSSSSR